MASNYGFVYILRNDCMPGIYKIGVTARDPNQRCAALSASTGVPTPFELVCYGKVSDAFGYECALHNEFSTERINSKREFFRLSDYYAIEASLMIEDRAERDGGEFVDVSLRFIKQAKDAFDSDSEISFLSSSNGARNVERPA